MIYNKGLAESIATTNGRYVFTTNDNQATADLEGFEYVIRDHLGNGRVWFMDERTIQPIRLMKYGSASRERTAKADGRAMNGPTDEVTAINPENRFTYNEKEFEEDWGMHNYGARFYDPSIARWTSVDPLAEKYSSMSPYNYVANNPLKYIDPDGREIVLPQSYKRKEILNYINSRSSGVFAYDNKGKLYLTDKINKNSEYGSTYYTDKIVEGIKSELTIKIKVVEESERKIKLPDGRIADLDKNLGGGCIIGGVCTDQLILLSGNSKSSPNLKDDKGNPLTLEVEDILMHEIVGHALPKTTNPDTGNAVENENKVRSQYKGDKKVLRQDEPDHDEITNNEP